MMKRAHISKIKSLEGKCYAQERAIDSLVEIARRQHNDLVVLRRILLSNLNWSRVPVNLEEPVSFPTKSSIYTRPARFLFDEDFQPVQVYRCDGKSPANAFPAQPAGDDARPDRGEEAGHLRAVPAQRPDAVPEMHVHHPVQGAAVDGELPGRTVE
jgi:hypothetical protein